MHRGDVHDLSVFLGAHERSDRTGEEERAVEIRADDRFPLVVFHVPYRTVAADSGIVHQDLHTPEVLLDLMNEALHVPAVSDVARSEEDPHLHLSKGTGNPLRIEPRL